MARDIAAGQQGVISRSQAITAGLSPSAVRRAVSSGKWSRIHDGVYSTWSGPRSGLTRVWAALRYAGAGATATHQTAAWLDGFAHEPMTIDVTVPERRRVRPRPGVRIHRSSAIEYRRHPTKSPPRSRVEETVLDLVEAADRVDDLVAVVTRACRQRLTTADRIAEAAAGRKKLRWRRELAAVLADVSTGAHAVLERAYLSLVERAHGLPVGIRQVAIRLGRRMGYRDVYYRGYDVITELDGPVGHEAPADRLRDMRRDNADALAGRLVLRFGHPDVTRSPCRVAAQVWMALRQRGWTGTPRRCGPECELYLP